MSLSMSHHMYFVTPSHNTTTISIHLIDQEPITPYTHPIGYML
jgi:uncharacterized protein YbcC (UPF0753/DUF2309 family)